MVRFQIEADANPAATGVLNSRNSGYLILGLTL